MEKFPQQEDSSKNFKGEPLFNSCPLSEEIKDKKEVALKLKEIKNSFLTKNSSEENKKNWDALVVFAKKIRNKYKDASSYWTYNFLIGSSTSEEKTPNKFDFEGDDSIEKFLRSKNI